MHGVPSDLPLERFVGKELNQIAIGRFDVQLSFASVGTISIWGKWELRDPAGAVVDAQHDHETRESYRLHRLLNLTVVRFELDPPRAFTLVFDPGYRLTVFDDTPSRYESFSIALADGTSVIV